MSAGFQKSSRDISQGLSRKEIQALKLKKSQENHALDLIVQAHEIVSFAEKGNADDLMSRLFAVDKGGGGQA